MSSSKQKWRRFGPVLILGVILLGMLMGVLMGKGSSHAIQPQAAMLVPQAGPDLVITSIVVEPVNPAINQGITISITVRNQGDVAFSGSRVHLYVDPVQQPPTLTTTHTTTNFYGLSLPAGGSYAFARTNHTFTTDGPHVIYAWVDRDNTVVESNEGNNLFGPVTVNVGNTGSAPDSYEDDDSCTQANTISVDDPAQLHTLSPIGDADWVKFMAVGGVSYVLEASPDGANGEHADLQLETYLTCDGKPSLGSGQRQVFKPLVDGTYYAKVDHSQATYGPKTAYKLSIIAENSCGSNHEPNNICTAATEIQVNGGSQTHNFCEQADQDWVKFPVQAGGVYVASVSKEGAQADVELSLFPNCDRVLGADIGQTLYFTAQSNGFVFLRTQSNNMAATGASTNYRVEVKQEGIGCGTDEFEDDNSPPAAKSISPNSPIQTRRICPPGEKDWAKFEATKDLTYTIETLNLANQADTVLCVLDSTGGTQLACSDDDGPGAGSRLIWQPPVTGTYLLQVRHFNSSAAGPNTQYDLHILATATTCVLDAAEPDNSRAEARPLTTSAVLSRNICAADDVDWVVFDVLNRPYVLQATSIGPEADSVMEIYDDAGTRLAGNDDFDPGTSAQLAYTFSKAGRYFARVRHYNPERQGNGTEYQISLREGLPPPTPTPPSRPSPTPTPPTQPQVSNEVQTLILVNRARMESLSNSTEANALMSKLNELAASPWVTGVVVSLEGNATVRAAYDAWLADMLNVSKANQVATTIRNLILQYREQYPSVKYVVLVGGDEALPFYRLHDNTTLAEFREEDYYDVSDSHATGTALRQNYFLSDDYYANKSPRSVGGLLIYTPDIAIGRLVETPADIRTFIQNFLNTPKKVVGNVLVTGYDFVQDAAFQICQYWRGHLRQSVNCDLISDRWTPEQYRNARLSGNYDVQSINGHANHYGEGTTHENVSLTAETINSHSVSFIGDLIYSMGCHGGLNVPSSNFISPTDLVEVFMRKGANYVGNTGYGYGLRADIGLSENLMRLYTDELLKPGTTSMGQALTEAKRRYVLESATFEVFDEKVVQQVVFYGLPMYEIQTSTLGATPNENRFPSVSRQSNLPPGVLGDDDSIVTGTLTFNLPNALNPDTVMSQTTSRVDGSYYTLDGSIQAGANQPVQPLFYENVTASDKPARSVIIKEATYKIIENFDPVIAAPMNEYITVTGETLVSEAVDWYPPYPAVIQTLGNKSNLVVQMGQYNAKTGQLRLFGSMKLELTYSTSADNDAPDVTVVDALYNTHTDRVAVKLGATDASGIESVSISYAYGNINLTRSENLVFDAASQKWVGNFAGDVTFNFQALVKDKAGNVTIYPKKGNRLVPARTNAVAYNNVFLPIALR